MVIILLHPARCSASKHVIGDCSEAFRRRVIEPFVRDYERGLTPSPCVGCNACMKVPELMAAADELKCDCVATGHAARVNRMGDTGRYAILARARRQEGPKLLLASLSQDQLARLVLPLGGMTKLAVRSLAYDLDLPAADTPKPRTSASPRRKVPRASGRPTGSRASR